MVNGKNTIKILWMATADARGHIMRAGILVDELRQQGIEVDLLTTSTEGQQFLSALGIHSKVLSKTYAIHFDSRHNMQRTSTDVAVTKYVFYPSRLLKDLLWLLRNHKKYQLIVNDSFHPMFLVAALTPAKNKLLHIYGENLISSLLDNFSGRGPVFFHKLFAGSIQFMLDKSRGAICHTLNQELISAQEGKVQGTCFLPPIVSQQRNQPHHHSNVVIYLNPHFKEEWLPQLLEKALNDLQFQFIAIGEAYSHRPHWHAINPNLQQQISNASFYISGLGMSSLLQAKLFAVPFIGILSGQPEQEKNMKYLREFKSPWLVLDINNESLDVLNHKLRSFLMRNRQTSDSRNISGASDQVKNNIANWIEVIKNYISSSTSSK